MTEPTIQQLFDLSGKAALVTGGTGHLGTAICQALAEAGASVVISSRERQRARAAAEQLPRPGDATHYEWPQKARKVARKTLRDFLCFSWPFEMRAGQQQITN